MAKVYLAWNIGRALAAQNLLTAENFSLSVALALKTCLDPEGEYNAPAEASQGTDQ